MEIKELREGEVIKSLALTWKVFIEFEAPEYSKEGVDEFRRFIEDKNEIDKLRFFGALVNNEIVGILAMRGDHISLFFVNKDFHRKGIGKALFQYMLKESNSGEKTVNSSPYAQEIYHKLGFVSLDVEQIRNGIRYIPMIYINK